jgi:spore germination cell wall hydrolase CwlJ-like protein
MGAAIVTSALSWSIVKKFELLEADRQAVAQVEPTAAERLKALECLTRNIYWEAAGESFEGKVAVAQVTLNRVESERFPNTVCGVVYQKNVFYERVVCQFSWFCEANHRFRPVHAAMYRESEEVAKKVLLEGFRLPSLREALFYHATYIQPGWRNTKITTIGQHIFYK